MQLILHLIVITLLKLAAGFESVQLKKGCEKTYATFSKRLDMCNAETKEMETEANAEFVKMDKRIEYNQCRIKELDKEWEQVRDEFRTGNEYLRPQLFLQRGGSLEFLQVNSSVDPAAHLAESPDWLDDDHALSAGEPGDGAKERLETEKYVDPLDEYYYSDHSPVEDPKCVCYLDDQCDCVDHCINLFNSCAARYKSTRLSLYETWKRKRARIKYTQQRIDSLEENIRRTRAADPEKDTDGWTEHKYRVSHCGGKAHVVR